MWLVPVVQARRQELRATAPVKIRKGSGKKNPRVRKPGLLMLVVLLADIQRKNRR